jgi:HEAT repeat protein
VKGIGKAAAPAIPALIELLRSAKPEFFQVAAAEHAVAALGAIGPEAGKAIPLLQEYLPFAEDFDSPPIDDFFHRSLGLASALAIYRISGDAGIALGVATKMLGDKSICLRGDAARVLKEIGMAGTEVRGIKGNQV